MQKIESSSNSIIKQTKKLLTAQGRKKLGLFILEGERLVRDAVSAGADIEYILVSESFDKSKIVSNAKIYEITDKLFDELKTTVNTQGVLAVAKYSLLDIKELDASKGTYLYLDSVSDPGNMGTIIRSANAFGIDGIVLSSGCTDVLSPKVLRSTMSGIFTVKLCKDDGNVLKTLKDNGFDILGTFPNGEFSPRSFSYGDKTVIVMGNEANGICPEVEAYCTHRITIPMTNDAESLNVSIACGIMLYEAFIARQ